jgi:hypothetical protein
LIVQQYLQKAFNIPRKLAKKIVSICAILIKIVFLIISILSIPVLYFIVLIAIEPRSFPIVDEQVEKIISENTNLKIESFESKVSFNYSKGGILIQLDDVKFTSETHIFSFEQLSFAIDIYKLLLGRVKARSIIVTKPKIIIDINKIFQERAKREKIARMKMNQEEIEQADKILMEKLTLEDYIKNISKDVIGLISNNYIKVKTIIIEDGSLITFRTAGDGSRIEMPLKLKYGSLKTWNIGRNIYFNINADIDFNDKYKCVETSTKCTIGSKKSINCKFNVDNFNINALSDVSFYNKTLKYYVEKVNGTFDVSGTFDINENKGLNWLWFNIDSEEGDFDLKEFFTQKIDFTDLEVNGSAKDNFKIFGLDGVSMDFDNTHFNMSLKFHKKKKVSDMFLTFNLNNLFINELDKLWPVFLNQNGIRDYVTTHISEGVSHHSYANMHFLYDNNLKTKELIEIDSKVKFEDSKINYSDKFPEVTDIDGVAHFNKDRMLIEIIEGKVLDTKLADSQVGIPDFSSNPKSLVVKGNAQGPLKDVLDHINYKKKSGKVFDRYFKGGIARTKLYIKLPIIKNLKLKYVEMKANAKVGNVNSKFVRSHSGFDVEFLKEFGMDDLNVEVDFKNSYLSARMIGFYKEKGEKAKLIANIVAPDKRPVILKNIELNGKDFNFKLNGMMGLRSGRVESFRTQKFSYGKTNATITYGDGKEKGTKDYSISGPVLDVSKIKPEDLTDARLKEQRGYQDIKTNVAINFDKVLIKNGKSLKNFQGSMLCDKNSCADFNFLASLYEGKMLKLSSDFDKIKDNGTIVSDIDLEVDDLGYFLEGFGITKRIIGGAGRMKAKNKIGDLFILNGKLIIDEKFEFIKTQYVNVVVEKDIEKSEDIENVQSLLVGSDTIEFDKAESRFKIKGDELAIKSMMLNNLEKNLGLTIEGNMNFKTGMIDVHGIVIPSYTINSLFGLGKIPVLGRLFTGTTGGGVFAPTYSFQKRNTNTPGQFRISKASAIAPGVTRNIVNFFKFDRDSAFDDFDEEEDED